MPNVAATVDYVGNVGHDQTGTIDINEGPVDADGEVTRLGIGGTFVYYSGIPVNELVGDDVNNDLDDFDRPIKGRDDAEIPILSEVDANGYAKHNTMPGNSDFMALNLRVQYEIPLGAAARRLGLYWELYNVTNRANYGNLDNERTSDAFNTLFIAGAPRTMQLGLRFSF